MVVANSVVVGWIVIGKLNSNWFVLAILVVIAGAFATITVAFTTTAFITATSGTFAVVGFIKTSVIIGRIAVVSLVSFASTFRTTVSQTYSDYSVTFNFTSP